MTKNGYIEVSEAKGKKLRTVIDTINGHDVHEEVVVLSGGGRIAEVSDENLFKVETHSNHEGNAISFGAESISTSNSYILIDRNNSGDYPHGTASSYIGLNWVIISGLGDATAVGDWTIGYISSIGVTGSVTNGILHGHFDKKEERFDLTFNFHPLTFGCRTIDHLANPLLKVEGDTNFSSTIQVVDTTGDSITPQIGDVFLKLNITSGEIIGFSAVVAYHPHE